MNLTSAQGASKANADAEAGGKTKVFGTFFKRNGSVYTEIVPDCRKKTLQGVIRAGAYLWTRLSIQTNGAVMTDRLMSDTASIFA